MSVWILSGFRVNKKLQSSRVAAYNNVIPTQNIYALLGLTSWGYLAFSISLWEIYSGANNVKRYLPR